MTTYKGQTKRSPADDLAAELFTNLETPGNKGPRRNHTRLHGVWRTEY